MEIESRLTKFIYAKVHLVLLATRWTSFILLGILVAFIVLRQSFYAAAYIVFLVLYFSLAVILATRAPRNRAFFSPVKYVFGKDGIRVETSRSKGTIKWSVPLRWRKLAGCYLIYISRKRFFIIPGSAIPPGKVASFESLLARRITRRA